MSKPVIDIEHFSDVLCVWAYIAQVRVDELQANFPHEVRIDYRFMQVFGDVAGKIATQWAERGGLEGYAAHVQEVAHGNVLFQNRRARLSRPLTRSLVDRRELIVAEHRVTGEVVSGLHGWPEWVYVGMKYTY